MRVNDVGHILVNGWGDLVSGIQPDVFTDAQVVEASRRAGTQLHPMQIRLFPEDLPGETLGQIVMGAISTMDLVDIYVAQDDGDVEVSLRWSANADEQIGATIKHAISATKVRRTE